MRNICVLSLILFYFTIPVKAQESFPVNGSQDERPERYALTNAHIVVKANEEIEQGTLLVEKEKIISVGENGSIPEGYVVYDMDGKYIYPSFIDAFSTYGVNQPKKKPQSSFGGPQIFESTKKGAFGWNEAIHPEVLTYKNFSLNTQEADNLQKFGFGTVQTLQQDGIARGSAAVVTLGKTKPNKVLLEPESSAHYSFDKGVSKNSYPSSIMGSVALLRQTYYDADWYVKQDKEANISLKEFHRLQDLPQVFEADELLDLFRINRIAKEFNKEYIIKTAGDEYKRINQIKEMQAPLIVPLNFPEAKDISDPLDAKNTELAELKHWELAPTNPSELEKAGVEFSFTSAGNKTPKKFWENLQKALQHGLSEEQALKALTSTPAKYLGLEDKLGSLENGKFANFLIVDKPIFEEESTLLENWIQGNRYVLQSTSDKDLRGTYVVSPGNMTLKIEGKLNAYKAKLRTESGDTLKANLDTDGPLFTLRYTKNDEEKPVTVEGYFKEEDELKGTFLDAREDDEMWSAKLKEEFKLNSKEQNDKNPEDLGAVLYPFVAYGNTELPQSEDVLFKNVTAWTNEEDGIVEQVDVLVKNGKIQEIGSGLKPRGDVVEIDGTDKHLTPGIIDEHSHLALQDWNEGAQEVTSEVRMLDALDSEDINIYRQLTGGVTTSQILHGSANPIGGQSQLIKLKWGNAPDDLKFGDNPGFIKFALGENVKQSNWNSGGKRFPQTRMGVEQVYVDAFTRARAYKKKLEEKNEPVRKDLELEILLEILESKRHITIHSYVQSEINMFMAIADSLGFDINTFTHILEGYKLADKMAERGIAAGTFSDWWAYKLEVAEAIPYNAHLLDKQGVRTAINSDDEEMGRRLNQEAAKAVKYGGTSQEDAFKMVTLNPAKILHIDDRVGSLKAGKDADVVLWSTNPLSINAVAEKTFIEGVKYWDIEENEKNVERVKEERRRLIQKYQEAKKKK